MSNIFGNEVPATPDGADSSPYTLGTRFRVTTPGKISHIRWRVPVTSQAEGIHIALFDEDWTALGFRRGISTSGTEGTWAEFALTAPISVVTNRLYTAAVYTPNRYPATNAYPWPKTSSDGYLVTDAPIAGFYNGSWDLAYPTDSYQYTSYFVDVRFTADSVTPAGPTVSVWNGTAEVAASTRVWTGSAEIAGSIAIA
ncbi:DUF4082 domain-containing protein [Actinoplanes sp. NPDC026670]|uniref:DUF4082 domain-containing protein n=1 Tax=Actinoplanes sp. NPDC026670 TaxID=3154700 RepID=UPI0033CE88B1